MPLTKDELRSKFSALSPAARQETLRLVIEGGCRQGDLTPLFHADQLSVFEKWQANQGRRFVLEIARRWGKTYFLLCVALMVAIRTGGRVVYGAPTLRHLKEFVLPTLDVIAQHFPADCRPRFNSTNSHIEVAGGGWVHLFGADDIRQADTGAGSDAELAIFDECGANGMASILGYIIKSIFGPSLLMTGGGVLLGSSPARIPDHEFTALAEMAEAQGCYVRRTIHDNPRLSEAQKRAFIESDAKDEGLTVEQYMATDTFRREHLAERVIDRLLVVLPEWANVRETQFAPIERPEFFDAQVILDFGGVDPHAAHFGYWHFPLGAYVIEDEVLLRDGENTEALVRALKAKESQLWGTDRWEGTLRAFEERQHGIMVPEWMLAQQRAEAPTQPRIRWADNDIQLCRDLHELHGYSVVPTQKDNLELQVNRLRLLVGEKKVFVHPRCVHTDRHWRGTTWANHRRADFARKANEHGDLLATGVYGVRNLNRQRNPFPPGYGLPEGVRLRQPKQESAADRLAKTYRR